MKIENLKQVEELSRGRAACAGSLGTLDRLTDNNRITKIGFLGGYELTVPDNAEGKAMKAMCRLSLEAEIKRIDAALTALGVEVA